jgi:UDP-N-acetylmuramoyl-tripeptide--D-alanyl-D-alanine ligase
MKRTLQAVASVVGGRLVGTDSPFDAVSTDSRTLPRGALFVALRGPNFDGNEFVAAAAAAGAVGALVDRPSAAALPQVLVGDPLIALQSLASAWRAQFDVPVVAVAGSNGKTTTKDMTAAILAQRGPCLATRGSLNNHIGVPLTLLRFDTAQRSAVIEVGTNRRGDVAELMQWVRPTVGLITNAGAEHLEFLGDLDGVAAAEGETLEHLGAGGTAVINVDDAYADYWRGLAGTRRVLGFGLGARAEFRVGPRVLTATEPEFVTRFELHSPLGNAPITLHAGGHHSIMNAAAAGAAAAAAGAELEDIVAGLARFRPVQGRLQLKAGRHGSRLLDDSYNANPSSVKAGLDVLATLPGDKWLVFGDMGEMGAGGPASHAEIGVYARSRGASRLFAVGALTPGTAAAFGADATWFPDVAALIRELDAALAARGPAAGAVTVLVKGSRVNRLERVVQALTSGAAGALPTDAPAAGGAGAVGGAGANSGVAAGTLPGGNRAGAEPA